MKLIRYEYPNFTHELDRFFGECFPGFARTHAPWSTLTHAPATDLYEDDNHYYVRVELPGFSKDSIDVQLEKNVLTIAAKRTNTEGQSSESCELSRSISVPEGVKSEAISAKLENGVLTLTLPKAEATKPRQISVN